MVVFVSVTLCMFVATTVVSQRDGCQADRNAFTILSQHLH